MDFWLNYYLLYVKNNRLQIFTYAYSKKINDIAKLGNITIYDFYLLNDKNVILMSV